jgi:hypothetical protein
MVLNIECGFGYVPLLMMSESRGEFGSETLMRESPVDLFNCSDTYIL